MVILLENLILLNLKQVLLKDGHCSQVEGLKKQSMVHEEGPGVPKMHCVPENSSWVKFDTDVRK